MYQQSRYKQKFSRVEESEVQLHQIETNKPALDTLLRLPGRPRYIVAMHAVVQTI